MFGNFDAPFPVVSLEQAGSSRSEAADPIAALFETMDIDNSKDMHGYGFDIDVTVGDLRLTTHPYCWCDRDTCPFCSGHFSCEDIGISAHELVELEPKWREAGFVTGHGAPNLWLRGGDIDIRLWWYKYIGRGMDVMLSDTLDWDTAMSVLTTFAQDAKPQTQALRKAQTVANKFYETLGPDYDAFVRALTQAPLDKALDGLHELCTTSVSATHELEQVSKLLTTNTRLPQKNRQGEPLSAAWRLKKFFEDPKRNTK